MTELYDESCARRDRIQIYADIIAVSIQPVKVNKILRTANIQYNSFVPYAEVLIAAGLMVKLPSPREPVRGKRAADRRTPFVFQATKAGHEWAGRVKEIYDQIQ